MEFKFKSGRVYEAEIVDGNAAQGHIVVNGIKQEGCPTRCDPEAFHLNDLEDACEKEATAALDAKLLAGKAGKAPEEQKAAPVVPEVKPEGNPHGNDGSEQK